MPISFPLRGALKDAKVARRYAVLCAVRFGLTASALAAVLVFLAAAGAPLEEGRSLLAAFAVLIVASSGAAVSAVLWVRAFGCRGRGAGARAIARVSIWIWLAGIPATIVVGFSGSDSNHGLLALALLIMVLARPPLALQRLAPTG